MAIVRRSGYPSVFGNSLLSDLFDDDRLINSPWLTGRSIPAVNVRETDKNFEIEVAAPGYEKNDFKVEMDSGLLTISVEKQEEKQEKEDNYTRREFGYSSFSRSFNLPQNINEEDINAKYEGGILKLTIAKKGEAAPKRKAIEIK
jgi:HSP20 family protein